jgi:ubiquinone/menaquinone biosynthesis C-methylase UbiE
MPVKEREAPILRRYARWAPRYDRLWARYSDVTLSRALALISQHAKAPERILDVACGTGLFAERLLARFPGARVVGVDLSPDMLERARARFNGDERVRWIRSSAERLPVESETFDVVACNNAFHLIPDQPAALAEFHRALKPGGTLLIIDWDRHAPSIKLVNLNYTVFGRHPRHIMNAEEIAATIGGARFNVEDTERFAATWFWRVAAIVARKPC